MLNKKVDFVRKNLLRVCVKNGAGHIASSLSCSGILVCLYYCIMNLKADPTWEDRDRLVFSKAHGCYSLYSILADIGYVPKKQWKTFYKGSYLSGCVERNIQYGIEASCGSLGHGLAQAVGIAFGAKLKKKKYRIYCVVGDGEMQEGSNWEAVQMAVKYQLANLTIIVDRNQLQAMDFLENILTIKGREDDLEIKFNAFGCLTKTCDGHRINDLLNSFKKLKSSSIKIKKPQVLIAKTIKGHGLTCMENVPKFHFRIPMEKELKI
jgi:transketolase